MTVTTTPSSPQGRGADPLSVPWQLRGLLPHATPHLDTHTADLSRTMPPTDVIFCKVTKSTRGESFGISRFGGFRSRERFSTLIPVNCSRILPLNTKPYVSSSILFYLRHNALFLSFVPFAIRACVYGRIYIIIKRMGEKLTPF